MKTFLLMLGSAFCGALLVVVGVYAYFSWQFTHAGPGTTVHFPARNEKTVEVAPPPVEGERFYGTYATMIEALDERNRAMSQSPRHYDRADFRVVE